MKDEVFTPRHPLLGSEHAVTESNRCINCYDAPCISACPTNINIPQFISRISSGDMLGSGQAILASNILGHSCATVCPVEALCEGSCVYNALEDPPIRIGDLQRYATEYFYTHEREKNIQSLKGAPKQKLRVAAIGGGPASLSFAAYIALNGGEAIIYEAQEEAGGLNTYGVAPYKLALQESLDEVKMIQSLGVEIVTGKRVGKDISSETLLKKYDALFIGTGLGADSFALDTKDITGVIGSLPLIARIKHEGEQVVKNVQKALVIGGGNTALDVAQELALCGVPSVSMAYRRGKGDMSGYAHELRHALSLGVTFLPHHVPQEVRSKNGVAYGVRFSTSNGDTELAADLIVFSTGQQKRPMQELFPSLQLSDRGTVLVDKKQRTSIQNVYAGGDCVNGGKEVVNAVAEGREAAYDVLVSNNIQIYYGRFSSKSQGH